MGRGGGKGGNVFVDRVGLGTGVGDLGPGVFLNPDCDPWSSGPGFYLS